MTAAALAGVRRSVRPSLRPVNPRTDMAQVADLIGLAFRGELDTGGLQMLREMRTFGRAGWLGYQLSRWMLPPAARPRGFVWEEQGRIVGNASLLPVEGYPDRWVLANVAVHPDWRRRGIARLLVRASLSEAERLGAQRMILQVARAKREVQALYADLGFVTTSTRTAWTRPARRPIPKSDNPPELQLRTSAEWEAQWEFLRQLHPEGLVWPFPPEDELFRPSGMSTVLGPGRVRHWLWREDGHIVGSLTAQARAVVPEWRLILGCAPEARGRLEAPLLAHALSQLSADLPAAVEYPSGIAEAVFESLEFRAGRSLTWMELGLAASGPARSQSEGEAG
jgi:ribosomal protein S18 acetylase RimI-like enzyme